jgi:hypothetical protein
MCCTPVKLVSARPVGLAGAVVSGRVMAAAVASAIPTESFTAVEGLTVSVPLILASEPRVIVRTVPAVFHESARPFTAVPKVWLLESPKVVSTLLTPMVVVAIVSLKVRVRVSVPENCLELSVSLQETEFRVGAVTSNVRLAPLVIDACVAVVVASAPVVPPTLILNESAPSVHRATEVLA